MENFNWVPLVVALLGGGGLGAAIREFVNMIKLSKEGVSGREDKRRLDIIADRDYAFTQLALEREKREQAEARFDDERYKRRIIWEQLLDLRLRLRIECGDSIDLPPLLEDTLPTKPKPLD